MDQPIATHPTIQASVANMQLGLMRTWTLLYATSACWLNRPGQRAAQAWRRAAARTAVNRAAIGQPPIEDVALTIIGNAALGVK